jgi:L-iditol 2-dehydrogenase
MSASAIATSMKASYLLAKGKIAVQDAVTPILEPDEVLVRVEAVGVCGSDVHYYRHGKIGPFVVEQPLILGHELSGTIAAVGSAIDSARVGQRVAVEPQRPCAKCEQCLAGRYNLCPDMEFFATPPIDGAFSEYVKIQSKFAFEIPDHVSFEAAALIEPLSVCVWAAQRAEIKEGSRVLIAGAGPIGVIMAQVAKAFGATEIFITDISKDRREFALKFGATQALDPKMDSVENLGVDAFVDASGVADAVYSGIKAVGPAGHVLLVGLGSDDITLPISHIQNKEIWVTGVFRYANTWPTGIELVASGKVNLDVLVTHKFGLGQVEEALNAGELPGSMKIIVQPNS